MLCYEINVNEQLEFHTLINSVTEEELTGNRSLWWLIKDIEAVNECNKYLPNNKVLECYRRGRLLL